MASTSQVRLLVDAMASISPSAPDSGNILRRILIDMAWTQGSGSSGVIDQVYFAEQSLTSGQTVSYNTLAAGALKDLFNVTIDLDELKGLIILPLTGAMRLEAPAADFIALFNDASDLLNVPGSGLVLNWGAAGLNVTTASKFDVTETAASTASYRILFWGSS